MSFAVPFRQNNGFNTGTVCARTFSLTPPIGKTAPRSVISGRSCQIFFDLRPSRAMSKRKHVTPAKDHL